MAKQTQAQKEQVYNDSIKDFKWLKYIDTGKNRQVAVPHDLAIRIRHINSREHVRYVDVTQLKSGRDDVSKFTYHDMRRFIDRPVYDMVTKLFDLDKDRVYMLKWLVRGLGMYPAYCRTVVNNLYTNR